LSTTWTIKVDNSMDKAANRAVDMLGYMSKAELIREAMREFLLRRGIFALVGDTQNIPKIAESPAESLEHLLKLSLPLEELEKIIDDTRDEVEAFVFPKEEENP